MWMTNFHQNLAHVASARLFQLKLLELLETLIVTISMDPLSALTTQTYVDGLHGPHPTQETSENNALALLRTVDRRATAYSWGNYLARI